MKTYLQVLLISLAILATSSVAANEGPAIESQMTTDVRNGQPIDNISQADITTPKTFLFSSILNCRGCQVAHVWYLDGNIIYRYQTTIHYDRTSWWTTRPGSGTGQWTAEVVVEGQAIDNLVLEYGVPQQQTQQYVIQKRLKSQVDTECEDRLEYYREQAVTNDDPYIQFMIKKWSARCSP